MALTVAAKADKPGRSAKRDMFAMAQRTLVCYLFTITPDNAYPNTGAEATRGYLLDATVQQSPYDMMRVVETIEFDSYVAEGETNGFTNGHLVSASFDRVNKRVRFYDNGTEVTNGTNISGCAGVIARAYGYA